MTNGNENGNGAKLQRQHRLTALKGLPRNQLPATACPSGRGSARGCGRSALIGIRIRIRVDAKRDLWQSLVAASTSKLTQQSSGNTANWLKPAKKYASDPTTSTDIKSIHATH